MSDNKKLKDLVGGDSIVINGWIWAAQYGGYTHVQDGVDMTSHGYVKVCKCDISGIVPEGFNATAQQVAAIEAVIEQTKEEYHQKLAQLNEAKENLLALPAPSTNTENFDDVPF